MTEKNGLHPPSEALLQEISAITQRLSHLSKERQRIDDQIDAESTRLQSLSANVKSLLSGNSKPTVADELPITAITLPQKLPKEQPRQIYERVKSILLASSDPEGLNFPQIVAAYRELHWEGWQEQEELSKKLRDAIKNLRKIEKEKIQHSGEKRGKYKFLE